MGVIAQNVRGVQRARTLIKKKTQQTRNNKSLMYLTPFPFGFGVKYCLKF